MQAVKKISFNLEEYAIIIVKAIGRDGIISCVGILMTPFATLVELLNRTPCPKCAANYIS